MAIAAINTVVANVMLIAELHRLLFLVISPGQIRRPRHLRIDEKRAAG